MIEISTEMLLKIAGKHHRTTPSASLIVKDKRQCIQHVMPERKPDQRFCTEERRRYSQLILPNSPERVTHRNLARTRAKKKQTSNIQTRNKYRSKYIKYDTESREHDEIQYNEIAKSILKNANINQECHTDQNRREVSDKSESIR